MSQQPESPGAGRPDPALEERLVRLESHVTQMERLLEELNQVVIAQGRQLQRVEQRHHSIASTLESIELDRIRATNSKPPHSVL
ncbi:MAG TPA: hypothetical protein DCM86_05470 [Verrucomicrobiales bacterium]|nr:hypothetical protein [Verrucomicrobiales bacterium]